MNTTGVESRGSLRGQLVSHELKCWPEFYDAVVSGQKKHDLRRADDRSFEVGDLVRLREYDPRAMRYTGRTRTVEITYITKKELPCALSEEALHPAFCILSIRVLEC